MLDIDQHVGPPGHQDGIGTERGQQRMRLLD
jgi:hypothetical protein